MVRAFLSEMLEYVSSSVIANILASLYPDVMDSPNLLKKADDIFHLNLCDTFQKTLEGARGECDDDVCADLPDEFLDPILFTPIRIPVKLPAINMFVDYSVISSHLLEHAENPFNRQKLTLEELEEYNLREDVMAECDDFLRRRVGYKDKTRGRVRV